MIPSYHPHVLVHQEAVRDAVLEGELSAHHGAGDDAALEPPSVLIAALEVPTLNASPHAYRSATWFG